MDLVSIGVGAIIGASLLGSILLNVRQRFAIFDLNSRVLVAQNNINVIERNGKLLRDVMEKESAGRLANIERDYENLKLVTKQILDRPAIAALTDEQVDKLSMEIYNRVVRIENSRTRIN